MLIDGKPLWELEIVPAKRQELSIDAIACRGEMKRDERDDRELHEQQGCCDAEQRRLAQTLCHEVDDEPDVCAATQILSRRASEHALRDASLSKGARPELPGFTGGVPELRRERVAAEISEDRGS